MGNCKLVLFFTRGVSLQVWDKVGMFDREVVLYQRLQQYGVDVSFVTYGNADDLQYGEKIPGINICCNRWGLPAKIYERLVPWLHRKTLHGADIIKTNQTNGAEIALRVAKHYNKPLIARCGYMLSEFAGKQHGDGSVERRKSLYLEKLTFTQANKVVVTTQDMRDNIIQRIPALQTKVLVIPNYVDTDLFHPASTKHRVSNRLCYVGRLDHKQKNLRSLLGAIKGLGVDLQIIGSGSLEQEIVAEAGKNPHLQLIGQVPNSKLPSYLSQCAAFVFPSFYEGHPKTLIEAMACGLPVITTDVPGIRNVIHHKQTGWLCGTDPDSLREGIKTVLSGEKLRERLGREARKFVVENYSLERILRLELEIYQNILQDNRA